LNQYSCVCCLLLRTMKTSYLCNCSRYCGNPAVSVSKSTYYKHAPFRQPNNGGFTQEFLNFVAGSSRIQSEASVLPALLQKRLQRPETDENQRPQKQPRGENGKGKEREVVPDEDAFEIGAELDIYADIVSISCNLLCGLTNVSKRSWMLQTHL
jgi:hypothetical protein